MTAQNDDGATPLHWASAKGGTEFTHLLLKHGADTTAREEGGWTPLHFAAQSGHIEVARLLLDCGADATAQDNDGNTPLHVAEWHGNGRSWRSMVVPSHRTIASDVSFARVVLRLWS